MNYAATITANLNDWLSNLVVGRKVALERSAARFASLVSPVSELEIARPANDEAPTVMLVITTGLHRDASMELTAHDYLIGSGDDCDIILRDGGIAPHHCRLARQWYGFALHDLRGEKPLPITPQSVNYHAGEIEAVYAIGGILLALRQAPPLRQETMAATDGHARVPWAVPAAVAAGLVLTIVAFAAANRVVKQAQPPMAERMIAGNKSLTEQGFGSTHFGLGAHGELEISGLVTDIGERERLRNWLRSAHYGDAQVAVQSASDIVDQVQHALAPDNLQIGLRDGQLRIEGTTPRLAVKDRIRALTEDLKGTVAVEDRVAYVDPRDRAAAVPPLPIKLRGVKVGNPSYFLTDRGARYFVGGVLPDGAEVLAIEAKQIRFRVADRVIVYNLE
jgi:type III secretion system (T3SS) inner membrane Yop/YscD-like protein